MLRYNKGKNAPGELSEEALTRLARRNMLLIAAVGLAIILADLLVSATGQTVTIERENGKLFLIRPAAGEPAGHIGLDASVQDGSETIRQHYDIRLDPQRKGSEEDPQSEAAREKDPQDSSQELIRSQLRSLTAGVNENTSLRKVILPSELDSGQTIRWSRSRSSNTILLILLTALLLFAVYRNRLQPIRKQRDLQRQSVLRQLPAFINELVLLLGAGLVLSRAFETVVEGSMEEHPHGRKPGDPDPRPDPRSDSRPADADYFTANIRAIYRSVQTTNASLHEELARFAKESGVSELMRVSRILSDNINKGAELNRKLERESEQLWLSRRLRAEEQGRLAETKMTFPLAIFLCVLIIITVSPALLQL